MKSLVYIGVAAVVTGAVVALYINWSIDRMVIEQGSKVCPAWLADTPQVGC